MTTARIITQPLGPGPDILDLLNSAAPNSEIALLHSADARGHSVLALAPLHTITLDESSIPPNTNPLATLQSQLDLLTLTSDAPVPLVGWIGGLSYDLGRHLESIGTRATDDMAWPLARFTLFRHYYLLDHATSTWTAATLRFDHETPAESARHLRQMSDFLHSSPITPHSLQIASSSVITQHSSLLDHTAKINRVQSYIAAGDVYQVNLAQRWTCQTPLPAVELYRRLTAISPAPYAAFLKWADRAVISASPEMFLHRAGNHMKTRPIKGTRPRSPDPAADARLRADLLASPKDAAELAMIVDLLRNDLGRVCAFGSVEVTHPRLLESHPTVWHTAAEVIGHLAPASARSPVDWQRLLTALIPGGSITGAPKIRAMQIIEELEPTRRGWYCGHLGWLGPDGGELNIAIRTILMQGTTAWVHAGGGIVADSDPAQEYEETLVKARAMLHALGAG